jgi:hypothetical protein
MNEQMNESCHCLLKICYVQALGMQKLRVYNVGMLHATVRLSSGYYENTLKGNFLNRKAK